jgi:hypothetical protein
VQVSEIGHVVTSCGQSAGCNPSFSRFQLALTVIFVTETHVFAVTSASVKSYQLVKVVSGGRAPGKRSSLASPQHLVIEQFHCFGAVRLEKVQFFYRVDF